MRNLKYILLPLILFVASCSTSQKITVSGVPGTEILSPGREHLGTIDQTGQLQLSVPSNSGYEFLLSRTSGDGQCVPFALDYQEHNYSGAPFCFGAGLGISSAGLAAAMVGLIMTACGVEAAIPAIITGFVAGGAGLGLGIPGDFRRRQTAYQWNYKYLNGQSTNQDILLTDVENTGTVRHIEPQAPKPVTQAPVTPAPEKSVRPATSTTSARSFKDYSKEVCGVYRGIGKLVQRGVVIENFLAISVEIQQIDKRTVSVDVQDGGSSFFYTKMTYRVEKDAQGGYILTSTDIPAATIKINSAHNLIYTHPSVDIDGDIYSLELDCNKH